MKEFRIVASRVTNYVAYVEAENEAEAEFLSSDVDWQFLDDEDYEVYTVEEVE